ncbi:hypothetical protein J7T55_014278 [Diaporthe amygdali]|uniref:uncharacterized protein n=1 Tax=Phomopsis amygdali TaxID=1214568 RepID=UPI0022FDEE1B|nr:uncharacterized protein J7T55_014278 [Diaporthe amygdali]KAJ0100718.1 hypothetical protein J7T55_014278 [Diaporthe amygdali]
MHHNIRASKSHTFKPQLRPQPHNNGKGPFRKVLEGPVRARSPVVPQGHFLRHFKPHRKATSAAGGLLAKRAMPKPGDPALRELSKTWTGSPPSFDS